MSSENATSYRLELNNMANQTILFSDRLDRIVESISTLDFIGKWSVGPNSFAADPPNAVLFYNEIDSSELDTVIMELSNPEYNDTNNSLIYDVITAINDISINIQEVGQSVLVVDNSDTYIGNFIDVDNFGSTNMK
ncbi:MAG: hypothetical protein R2685_13770 [Candidatus Nitrosocosmicus sp.]|nr:hypothetical protein [Candidatus Nitrosocosmicus sp.]